jgi:hypothetical protein
LYELLALSRPPLSLRQANADREVSTPLDIPGAPVPDPIVIDNDQRNAGIAPACRYLAAFVALQQLTYIHDDHWHVRYPHPQDEAFRC